MRTTDWKKQHYAELAKKGIYTSPCWICGKKRPIHEASIDHVFPRSLGGKNEASNYRVTCKKCNERKGSKVLSKRTKAKRNWNSAQRGY
jgi:5-methylcytosine-specific restriction endonuclease McrA